MAARIRVGSVEVNGAMAHYWEMGHGPPLVFIHGLGFDLSQWQAQMRFFAPGYRVIAYDLRGHGLSAGKEESFDFLDWVSDLRALLAALGVQNPYLCGHGLGAEIALQYAITYPQAVAAVVAADALSPRSTRTRRLGFFLQTMLVGVSWIFWPWSPLAPLALLKQSTLYSRAFRRDHHHAVALFRSRFRSLAVSAFLRAGGVEAKRSGTARHLSRIEAPVLLLRGTKNRLLSLRQASWYRHGISHSQLHQIQDSGHMTLEEQPSEFNDLVDLFLLGRLQERDA